jgi:Ion channel
LLHELGYSNVRDYRGGLADWSESGGPLESDAGTIAPSASDGEQRGPGLGVSPNGYFGTGPARVMRNSRWHDSISGIIAQLSTAQLFLIWIVTVVLCGLGYWAGALLGEHGLVEAGAPIGTNFNGLLSSLYFSFVTATSLGYGDIVPLGFARALAVAESVGALVLFGAVIAKFVSHRQDELVLEIHRITFDERLDRVQSNLHLVISELLAINSLCETPAIPMHRIGTRLDSAVLLFVAELRTTHDLLYQPKLMVEEVVLSSILANLASALDVLAELLACLPSDFTRSDPLQIALHSGMRIAEDICGSCVPHDYTPRLIFWMDRIQSTSRKIH